MDKEVPARHIIVRVAKRIILTKTFTVYSWTVKRGQDHQFADAWKDFAKWVTRQKGSSGSTRLFRDLNTAGHFLSVDAWENEESLRAFLKEAEFGLRVEGLRKFLDGFSSWPLKLEAEERDKAIREGP